MPKHIESGQSCLGQISLAGFMFFLSHFFFRILGGRGGGNQDSSEMQVVPVVP